MKVRLRAQSIRHILAKKNMTQNWLAQRIATSSGYMSQMMTGIRNPSPRMREKMIAALKDYQFDDLFTLRSKR